MCIPPFKVTVGFTTAAAFTIGSSQIKSLLGLKGSTNEFIPAWENVITNIEKTKLTDTLLGVCTIGFLLALKVISKLIPVDQLDLMRLNLRRI